MDKAKAAAVKAIDHTQSALEGAKQNVSILAPQISLIAPRRVLFQLSSIVGRAAD